jgi:hypothetical protein
MRSGRRLKTENGIDPIEAGMGDRKWRRGTILNERAEIPAPPKSSLHQAIASPSMSLPVIAQCAASFTYTSTHARAPAAEVEHARIGIERHVSARRIQDVSADRRAAELEPEELHVTMHAFAQCQ